MKSIFKNFGSLVVVSALALFGQTAHGGIIFNNTATNLNTQFTVGTNGVEFGDQITLAAATNQVITQFAMEYFAVGPNGSFTGNESMEVRFYANNGAADVNSGYATPGTLLWDSLPFSMATYAPATTGDPNEAGTLTWNLSALGGGGVEVPSNFTWAVTFNNISAGESAGVDLYGGPTVGSDTPDYWLNTGTAGVGGTAWTAETNATTAIDFAAILYGGNPPLNITTQPTPATKNVPATTGSATYSVTASGTGPFTYQWYLNDNQLSGKTLSSLTVSGASLLSGVYYCVVANSAGSVMSDPVTLNVIAAPTVTGLTSQTNISGTTATFTIVTNGTPATIRWYHTSVTAGNLVALNTNSYSFTALDGSAGVYLVQASNIVGVLTSASSASLTVYDLPTITVALTNLTVNQAANATLYTKATSNASSPMTNYWQFSPDNNNDFVNVFTNKGIPTAVTATYLLGNAQAGNQGYYQVISTTAAGSATNGPIFVTVAEKPVITSALALTTPSGVNLNVGSVDTLSVGATGFTPLTYYWTVTAGGIYKTVTSVPSLTLPALTNNAANTLYYVVSVTVSNRAGVAVSSTPAFFVNVAPKITLKLTATPSVLAGLTYKYVVAATGTPAAATNFTYYWTFNSNPIGSTTSSTYTVEENTNGYLGALLTDAGAYSVTVSNLAGTASSSSTLTVTTNVYLPTITILPSFVTAFTNFNLTTLSGLAGDSAQVTNVIATLNGTNDLTVATTNAPLATGAQHWSSWVIDLDNKLVPGTNTIVVQAVDFSGKVTAVATTDTKKIIFFVTNSVPVKLTGTGSVYGTATPGVTNTAPTTLSVPLAVGLQYTLTGVTNGTGQVFSNWLEFPSGTAGSGTASVTNYSPTLSFFVSTNGSANPIAIEGDFTPSPFNTNITGTYNGLYYEGAPDGVQLPSAGFITMTIDSNGLAIPLLYNIPGLMAPAAHPLFNALGQASFTIVRAAPLHNLIVNLQVDLTGASQAVSGTVAESFGAWVANLTANRNTFYAGNTNPNTGLYTFAIPSTNNPTADLGPDGSAYAYMGVSSLGRFTISGNFGDTATEAEEYPGNIYASKDGDIPLFIWTRHGNVPDGALIGWINVTNQAGVGTNLTGSVVYEQITNAKAYYPLGFTNMYSSADTSFVGSYYVTPAPGSHRPVANFGSSSTLTFSGGDLPSAQVISFTFNEATDTPTITGGTADVTVPTFMMVPTAAGFSGTFMDNIPNPPVSVSFTGGVLQDPSNPMGVSGWGSWKEVISGVSTNIGNVTIP